MLPSHEKASASATRLLRVLRLLDLANHAFESCRDVRVQSCTGFDESALPLRRQLSSFFGSDSSLLRFEIGFVSDYHQWDLVGALFVEINARRG